MAYLLCLVALFLLTAGFCHLRLQSPPSPSSSAPVDLAHAAWSTLASFAGAPALALWCLWCLPRRRIGCMAAATLTSPPCCAQPLGREHDAAPSLVQPLDGGLAATIMATPSCRRHGLLPCSSVSTPVSFFSSSFLLYACYGGLASEPGMLAYAVDVPCYCCCSAQACAAASLWILLLWVSVQVLVHDSVKNFLIWTWYDYLGIFPCAISLTMCCVIMATVSMKFS
jgi:hypothetical protein